MQVELYTPYDRQLEVHHSIDDESHLFDIMACGRQTGKTTLAMNTALKWCLQNNNIRVGWVSPTASQTTKVYKAIVKSLNGAPFLKSYKQTQGDIEITFTNGSVILFKSAMAEDGLRGNTFEYLILDEAAFIKQSTFLEILLPTLNVAGRKCLIISTPKGKNWFYEYYMKGAKGVKGFKSFRFNCYQNPFASQEIIEIARSSMPSIMFDQEYLAEFVDGASVFQNINELCVLPHLKLPLPRQTYYAGIDVATKRDKTVITIVDSSGYMVAYERFTDVTGPQLKERIVRYLDKWKPAHTLIEVNNLGGVIYDDLIHIYKVKNLSPFNTTSKSKPEIINNLINAFDNKAIKCVDDEILKEELSSFEMQITSGGNIRYAAGGSSHDDMVMSLAFAREAMTTANKNVFKVRILN